MDYGTPNLRFMYELRAKWRPGDVNGILKVASGLNMNSLLVQEVI